MADNVIPFRKRVAVASRIDGMKVIPLPDGCGEILGMFAWGDGVVVCTENRGPFWIVGDNLEEIRIS